MTNCIKNDDSISKLSQFDCIIYLKLSGVLLIFVALTSIVFGVLAFIMHPPFIRAIEERRFLISEFFLILEALGFLIMGCLILLIDHQLQQFSQDHKHFRLKYFMKYLKVCLICQSCAMFLLGLQLFTLKF